MNTKIEQIIRAIMSYPTDCFKALALTIMLICGIALLIQITGEVK